MHRSVMFYFLAMISILATSTTILAQEAPPGATSCSGCHGTSSDADLSLDAFSAQQIIQAMEDFRSGVRQGTIMGRIALGFNDAEIKAIAEWLTRSEK